MLPRVVVAVVSVVVVDVFVVFPILVVVVVVVVLGFTDVLIAVVVLFDVIVDVLVDVILMVVVELLSVVVVGDTVVLFPPPRHWHISQKSILTFNPQQSPLSKLHCTILLISSQNPSPTHRGLAGGLQRRLSSPVVVVNEVMVVIVELLTVGIFVLVVMVTFSRH